MENIGTITEEIKNYFQSIVILTKYSLIMLISKSI